MRLLFLLILLTLTAGEAAAHGRRAGANTAGLAIPSLSHGALVVLDEYYGAILSLADRASDPDPVFRKLQNYARIQNYYCLWGLAPRAIADEESPFNECSHAYLSASRSLLLHMRGMASVSAEAGEMASRIDAEMTRRGSALIQCAYSGEPFHTGDVVTPHWENLADHTPSLIAAASPVPMILGLTLFRRHRRGHAKQALPPGSAA